MKTKNPKLNIKLALALLACSAALTAMGDYPSTVISQGPVGYWRLGESGSPPPPVLATNSGSLGAAENGTYVGDPARGLTGPLAGSNGKAINLVNPTTTLAQAVQTPYAAALNPASFTIEAWLQPGTATPSGGLTCALASMHSGSPRSGWLIYQSSPGGVGNGWNFRLYNQNGTATSANVLGAATMTAGAWYHVVATFNAANSNASVYVNGALAGSATATGFVPNPDSAFSIGARSDNGFAWLGEAAEVAYYSTALPASTIAAHYAAATTNAAGYGAQITGDGPIVYYRFLEPAEPIAVNLGTFGAAANGTYVYNAMPGQPGPQSPAFPGFSSTNTGVGFDGNSGYVRIPPLNLNSDNVTITAWVNLNTNASESPNAGIVFCDSGATEAGLKFDQATPDQLAYDWSSDTAGSFNSGLAIPASGWAYVALVTFPDHAVLAVQNGTNFQFATNFTTLGPQPFAGFTLIGSDGGSSNLTFSGTIDEVAIFNRSLGVGELYSQFAAAAGTNPPIVFLDPHAPAQLFVGDTLNLSVDAGGTPALTYFWRKAGAAVQTGTAPTFSIASLATSDSAAYDVIVSNSFGSVTSAVANVTVSADTAPSLVQGPVGETVYQGGTISLNAVVIGGVLHYQWQLAGNPISGATGSALTIPNAVGTNAGNYTVVAYNFVGTNTYGPATVNVIVPAAGSYAATVISNSPVAWWRLNDPSGTTMTDSMGRYNGSYTGGVTLGQPGLPFGGTTAATFDGTTGYGFVPYTTNLNSEIFSVEAWVNTADQYSTMGVLGSYDDRTSGPFKGRGHFIQRTSGTIFQSGIGENDFFQYYFVNLGFNITSKWTQLVVTYGASGLNYYQDGVLSAGGFGDFVRNTSSPFQIGAIVAGTFNEYWNGSMADVSYYNTALTAAQINAHYQAALYGNSTAPIFIIQPQSQLTLVGGSVTFSAHAEGTAPIGLQWLKNNVAITGATNASLTLSNVFYTDAASYVLQATNSVGSTNSTPAVLTVTPPPAFVNATNGLVLHLRFDGDSLDSSGHGNNGTNSPSSGTAVPPIYVPGHIGSQAIQFTTQTSGAVSGNPVTSASYVELGAPADLEFSSNVSFSVSMWVQFPAGEQPGDLPFFGNAANSTFNTGYLMAPSYKTGSWAWSLEPASGGGPSATGAAGAFTNGNWHNLIYTFDRSRTGNGITYVDGVQVDVTPDAGGGDVDSGFETVIGQDPTFSYTEPATFSIDDLGVWRRVLTPFEAYAINHVGNTYGRSFDEIGRVPLTIQKVSGGYAVIWQAGQLESSTTLTTNNASWTPVAGAAAPYYQFVPGSGQLFFRVHP